MRTAAATQAQAGTTSGLVRGLRELGPEVVVVTNEPAAVELWTGRAANNLLELEAEEDSPGSALLS